MPAKGAREARPFVDEAIVCTFSIFFARFQKNDPDSFPHHHDNDHTNLAWFSRATTKLLFWFLHFLPNFAQRPGTRV